MPSWRRTLTSIRGILGKPRTGGRTAAIVAISRPIIMAATLLIPAKGASAQTVNSNAFTLQPHSVRTLLRDAPHAEQPGAKPAHTPQAVAHRAQNVEAILRRAAASLAKGDRERALADYDLAIRTDPNNSAAFYQRGQLHRDARDFERALDDFGRMIRLDSRNLPAHYSRALVHLDMGDHDRAIRDLDQAISVKPDYAPAFSLRGRAYAGKGETRRSMQDFDHAIGLDPTLADAYLHRGEMHQSMQRLEQAIADYTQAVRFNPKHAYSLYSLGLAKRAAGDEAQAQIYIGWAKDLEPGIGP
jgi:tetratricopeptide (TPR) repeat protein